MTAVNNSEGFWIIPVAEECIPYCGVAMYDGIYLHVHIPMGITTAPYHFRCIIDQTLKGIKHATFLDDAIIEGIGWLEA